MTNFDAIHSLGRERGDTVTRGALRRMREDRQTAGVVDEADGVAHSKSILRHERWASVAEVAVEGVAEIDRPTFGDHRAGNVRPPDGAAGCLLEDRVELDTHAKLVQTLNDSRCARASHFTKRNELRFHLPGVREMETEDMRFDIVLDRAELDARHDSNADLRTGGDRFRDAIERIVIGERDGLKTHSLCFTYDVCWSTRPIRRRGVRVEVDEGSGAVANNRRRGHAV